MQISPALIPIDKLNSSQTTSLTDEFKNSLEAIRSRHSKELVIALCGAVGAGVKRLKSCVFNELKAANYHVVHIRLSDLIAETTVNSDEIKQLNGYPRYKKLQDLGDELRKDHSNSIIAELGIRKIAHIRNNLLSSGEVNGKAVKTTKKIAYIVDQIKHHEEIELFQEVYRKNFYLIGLLRTQNEREKNLREEGITNNFEIAKLIERDRNSNDKHGQHVEKAIQKSDYFIRNLDELEKLSLSIKRLINLIHDVGNVTPKRDEKGLFSAYSASLSSACLSRQVGAAIMDKHGNIIATGCNDVPQFKGGLYNADGNYDKRCYNKSGCQNDKHKIQLKNQIKEILKDEGIKNPAEIANKIFNNSKAKSLIEYSRAVHAEMDAIISLARCEGSSSLGKTLYCTTYPCHNCARHIVAAGIERVIYIKAYEKSLAMDLHGDSICHVDNKSDNKLLFQNFEGVSPLRYAEFFIYKREKKDELGNVNTYELPSSTQVEPHQLDCYVDYELKVIAFVDRSVGEVKS